MAEELKTETPAAVPEKITIVIDPVSKPLEAINGGIDLIVEGGKAVEKGFKIMGKKMKKIFR
jgi:hypothetical protein